MYRLLFALLIIEMTLYMLVSLVQHRELPNFRGVLKPALKWIGHGPDENSTESTAAVRDWQQVPFPDAQEFKQGLRSNEVAEKKHSEGAELDLPVGDLQAELQRRIDAATDTKIIVVWHAEYKNESIINVSPSCAICEVTFDKSKINDTRAAAVVVHRSGIEPSTSLPPLSVRNPQHLYIYWDNESTGRVREFGRWRIAFDIADSYGFNATMTYRRDSDFYMSDGDSDTLRKVARKNTFAVEELLKLKNKTAVVVISNCGAFSIAKKRLQMIKEIKGLGFALDSYGNCFEGGQNFANSSDRQSEEFHREVGKYKFYFAFENSYHCKDYITEKFFDNALRSKTVPVVWGAKKEDYEVHAPSGSFIHVEDFASLKDLVEYLQYLDKNDTAYMEYLRWLEMDPSDLPPNHHVRGFCAICRALHGINVDDIHKPGYEASNPERPLFTDGVSRRTVPSLKQRFYETENPECFF